ncbi:MAG: signal peptidase II [Deferribacterales bacterium]
MRLLLIIFFAIIGLDQYTKYVIYNKLELYESIPVIDGFFNITYVLNPGAAFGFLANLNEKIRVLFFVVVTIIAISLVIYLLKKEWNHKIRRLAYIFILSGAIGNLIDRIWLGKVIDFLDFYIKSYHWPAFNVADTSISIGVGLLLLDIVILSNRKDINR